MRRGFGPGLVFNGYDHQMLFFMRRLRRDIFGSDDIVSLGCPDPEDAGLVELTIVPHECCGDLCSPEESWCLFFGGDLDGSAPG